MVIGKLVIAKGKFNKENDKKYTSTIEWENTAKYFIKVEALSVEPCNLKEKTNFDNFFKGREWRYTCKVLVEITLDNLDTKPGVVDIDDDDKKD